VIDLEGKKLGHMSRDEATELAESKDAILKVVNTEHNPPICRLMLREEKPKLGASGPAESLQLKPLVSLHRWVSIMNITMIFSRLVTQLATSDLSSLYFFVYFENQTSDAGEEESVKTKEVQFSGFCKAMAILLLRRASPPSFSFPFEPFFLAIF
jgi:hypothetical protein